MNEYTTFPKEFERDWLGELDKRFLIIFLITLLVHVSLVVYLQGVKWAQMTEEDVGQYLMAIYRVSPAEIKSTERNLITVTSSRVEEKAPEKAETPAPQKSTAEKVVKRRSSKAKLARQRALLQESARRMGIFRVAGALASSKGAGTAGSGSSGVARALNSGGGLEGVAVGKIAGIASGSLADKIEKARAGLRLTEGAGGIDISQLSDAQIDEILAASSVEIAQQQEVEGLAAKTAGRNGASIRAVADANMHLIKNCYNRYKRKDLNLKGKVKVEWTILPGGQVNRVRILSSQWTRPNLGRRVERCLKEVIATWLFDPIRPEAGQVRARQTYIFD